jgi:hypothetical protein
MKEQDLKALRNIFRELEFSSLYREIKIKDEKRKESHEVEQTIIVVDSSNKKINQEVIDYTIKTKNFKIDKNFLVVDYEGKTYYINRDILK